MAGWVDGWCGVAWSAMVFCALRCNKLIAGASQTALLLTHYAISQRRNMGGGGKAEEKWWKKEQLRQQRNSKLEAEHQHVGMSIILYQSCWRSSTCTERKGLLKKIWLLKIHCLNIEVFHTKYHWSYPYPRIIISYVYKFQVYMYFPRCKCSWGKQKQKWQQKQDKLQVSQADDSHRSMRLHRDPCRKVPDRDIDLVLSSNSNFQFLFRIRIIRRHWTWLATSVSSLPRTALNRIELSSIRLKTKSDLCHSFMRRRSINYIRTFPPRSGNCGSLFHIPELTSQFPHPEILLVVSRSGHRQHPAARSQPGTPTQRNADTWPVQWARTEWQRMSWRSIESFAKKHSLLNRVSIIE